MLQRWLGLWVLRRAYRLLFAEDARPVSARLVGEAKRIFVAAALVLVVLTAAVVAAVVVLVRLVS